MKINKQARRDGKSLFRCCVQNDQLDETRVRAAVTAVLERKPRGYLAVLHHFSRLVKLEVQRRTALVESSFALAPDVQAQISERLAAVYGPGLSMTFSENASLIGGIRVQVGSDVIDGSVRSRLNSLAGTFTAS
jgi:F-type H+-transporting ATPase subunit delta